MGLFFRHLSRCVFGLCVAVVVTGQAQAGPPLAPDLPAGAVDRVEHRRLASEGKVLPGTPDLTKLDERLATHHVTRDASIMIRIFKAESELEVWMTTNTGGYALFATYPVCFWSGTLGPKLKEGDRQAPEGFYTVALAQTYRDGARLPVALDLGFPNSFDKLNARGGSGILIHGDCASIGCFAMTNPVNNELNKLVLRSLNAGQAYVPIHVFPFRMTKENFNRYDIPEWRDFWRNLKEGYDLFERTRRPQRVSVCDNSYGFQAASKIEGANPGPIAVCPRTEAVLRELDDLNTRVAEQTGPLPAQAKPVPAYAFLYLVRTPNAPALNMTRIGSSSYQQLAGETVRAGVSAILTRSLRCSMVLSSCRRYAALRDKLATKAVIVAEEEHISAMQPVVYKKRRRTASR
jgi:murein L,D-transpeptidase YafK